MQPQIQTEPHPPDLDNPWMTQLHTLASMAVGYAPSVAGHDPALARMLTLSGLRLAHLLDRLDDRHP